MTKRRIEMKLKFFIYITSTILFKYINLITIKKINLYKLNEIIYYFKDYTTLYKSIKILKKNSLCQFQILNDICVIDNPISEKRFSLIYNLFSIIFNIRVFLKIFITETSYLESINMLYKNSI
jgi:NADH:ubiquinone oxidoreductase subunit C